MRKKFNALVLLLVIIQMIFGTTVTAFAEEDEPRDNGTPKISVVNGPVFDVEAGKSNDVSVEVKNLSAHGAVSVIVIPKINEIENNPLKITMKQGSSNFSILQPNAGRKLEFVVDVDKAAPGKTYSVDVKFSFFNQAGNSFDSSSTIYFKVKNPMGLTTLVFDKISVDPDSLEIGGAGKLNVALANKSNVLLRNVEVVLSDIDVAGVSVSGLSSKKIAALQGGIVETVSFDVLAGGALAVGSYPITVTATGTDENGSPHTITQKYYVAVGGSSSGKKSDIEIRGVKEPSGTFGVNENFVVSFEVFNKGDLAAKDIKISAKENGEGANVVPKSNGVISVKELAPNTGTPASFTFAATGAAASKNFSIALNVEFMQNGKATTVTQYAGVNVSNPDSDGKTSKPKIIVSDYSSNPVIVQAGEEFDLTMSFLNTHAEKEVKNVKMYLTLSEETSTESKSTGNIFTPVNSSNTFFFDSIPSKGTVNKDIRLYVVPEAQPKTYTLTVNFEYEDSKGNEFTAKELLGINVKQSTKVETSEVFVPTTSELFMPVSIFFDIYNTGKVDVSNLKISLDGDIESSAKTTFIGNCAKGESNYYEGSFTVMNEGANKVTITVSYDDPSGEKIEDVKEYTIEGTQPMPMDPNMDPSMGGNMGMDGDMSVGASEPMSKGKIAAIVIIVIILIGVALFVFKKVHAKKAEKFIQAEDDDDDEIMEITDVAETVVTTEEGNGKNEQL